MPQKGYTTELTVSVQADVAKLKKQLARAKKQVGGFGKSVSKVGGILAGAFAGQKLIGGIKSAILKIADLENKIKRVSLIAGGGEKAFSDLAKQLGGSTVFTSQQSAEAMTFLAQAGFNVNQILAATPGILDLAAAAQLDLAAAADITSNVLSGFGLNASEVNRVNDILVTTTNSANLNVEMLGESFKLVAPIAKSAGISINKAAGFIGVLGDAGIQGSMAGTQLKGVIAQLINPTAKGAAVMKRLGVEVTKTETGGLDLSTTLNDLKKAGLTTKDAFQLFGKIAATGALVMADATEKADALAIATEKIGVASDQAKEQLNTLSGDIDLMSSAWEGLIQKGSALNGFFRSAIQGITELIGAFESSDENLKRFRAYEKGINDANDAMLRSKVVNDLVTASVKLSGEGLDRFLVALKNSKEGEEALIIIKGKLKEASDKELTALAKLEAAKAAAAEANIAQTAWRMKLFTNLIQGNMARFDSFKAVNKEEAQIIRDTSQEKTDRINFEIAKLKELAAADAQKSAETISWNALVSNSFQGMANVITNALSGTENIFQAFGKFFADMIKGMLIKVVAMTIAAIALVAVLSLIPGMGVSGSLGKIQGALTFGKKIGASINALGGFANGGVSSGGLAVVGERGKEIVSMPQGSRVMSHPDTMKAIGGGGGKGNVTILVNGFVGNEQELAVQLTQVLDNQSTNIKRLI